MNTASAPELPLCENDSREQESAYDAWIRAELLRRRENPGREIPHAQVMAEVKAIIESKRKRG